MNSLLTSYLPSWFLGAVGAGARKHVGERMGVVIWVIERNAFGSTEYNVGKFRLPSMRLQAIAFPNLCMQYPKWCGTVILFNHCMQQIGLELLNILVGHENGLRHWWTTIYRNAREWHVPLAFRLSKVQQGCLKATDHWYEINVGYWRLGIGWMMKNADCWMLELPYWCWMWMPYLNGPGSFGFVLVDGSAHPLWSFSRFVFTVNTLFLLVWLFSEY